jgi:hypothetical protein
MNMTVCDPEYRVSGGQEMDTLEVQVPQMVEVVVGDIEFFIRSKSEAKFKVLPQTNEN